MTKKFPRAIVEKALALRREGKSYSEISVACTVPTTALSNWFFAARIIVPQRRKYALELKDSAFQLKKDGLTIAKISERLGVHPSTLKRWFVKRARPRCIKQRGPSPSL